MELAPLPPGDPETSRRAPTRLKDAAEEELEKLVFGDLAGFQAGLEDWDLGGYESGGDDGVNLNLDDRALVTREVEELEDDQLFFVDSATSKPKDLVSAPSTALTAAAEEEDDEDKPVWEDSDDERLTVSLSNNPRLRKLRKTELDDVITGTEYSKRLRLQYERINPVPLWSLPASQQSSSRPQKSRRTDPLSHEPQVSDSEDDDSMDISIPPTQSLSTLLHSTSTYTSSSKSRSKLPPENLDISRLRDANHLSPSHSGIQSISFHPTHPLLLSAGHDHTLRLYHIDKKTNPPATSLYLQSTPLHTAAIHADGRRVFAGGRRRYFHIWDLESGKVEKVSRIYGPSSEHQKSMELFRLSPCGRFMALAGAHGWVNVLDAKTGLWISAVVVEGIVADVCWSADGRTLFVANKGGEVWEWDSAERKVETKWRDEGGVGVSRIAVGGKAERWCAVGSASGVVNVYDRKVVQEGSVEGYPKPKRALGNLVTGINVLEFSGDGQLLCIGSKEKRDAMRLVHLPTVTVYKNWPTTSTPVGNINCAGFANQGSGLFAFGNQQGKIRLWEIR